MAFVEDFKKFAFKGNVVDLAVGVVIGAAFGKIVSALVADLVMPFVALIMPSGDWRTSGIVLRHAEKPADDVVLKYVERYVENPRVLAEGLQAIAVAGEERALTPLSSPLPAPIREERREGIPGQLVLPHELALADFALHLTLSARRPDGGHLG